MNKLNFDKESWDTKRQSTQTVINILNSVGNFIDGEDLNIHLSKDMELADAIISLHELLEFICKSFETIDDDQDDQDDDDFSWIEESYNITP